MMTIFLETNGEPFTAFGTSHLMALLIYFTGATAVLLFSRTIRSRPSVYMTIRWTFFSVLMAAELSYQIYTALNGIWSAGEHLFLHLCGAAGITGTIALIRPNKQLIRVTFFIGFIPALMALMTPELPYDFPHFRYFKFFIHHIVISWTSLFLVISHKITILFSSLLKTYVYLLIYAAFIGFVVNPLLGANYLYLSHTPAASTPLDLLGSGIWYYVNLCMLAFCVFLLQYLVYRLVTRHYDQQM